MATPVVTDFSAVSSARQAPEASTAHTPVIVDLEDDAKDEAITASGARRKQLRMAFGACVVLVALVVGCAVGFSGSSSVPGAAASSSDALSSQSLVDSGASSNGHSQPTHPPPDSVGDSTAPTTTPTVLGYETHAGAPSTAPTTTQPTTPAPTATKPRLPYKDTKFDWLNIDEWQGDNDMPATFAKEGFKSNLIEVTTFGQSYQRSPVLRTKQGWAGEKVIYLEWTVYAGSDANIWMLPTALTSQFGDPRWPNCGEYDIFEMFNGDAAIGHTGTTDAFWGGGLSSFGQSTMHMASTNCFAPYYVRQPNVGSQAAQWKVEWNAKISMAVVFGTDGHGQFIQQIRNPKITRSGDTVDVSAEGGVATDKIYNNANMYWGVAPTGACAAGHNPATGYPFWNAFRLVLQEQYQGRFEVHTVQVFTK
ncbi:hypothetical protein H310_14576 [Aphanomyces invadans]|uniref:Uncharacterized protein n=1 Tax=Aphanomyces invadans TaxID=157072 RepID=A0A024TBE2_9STRA|nr:hypothetical protein H310_14576 [Aphanomyces invadans]ETV90682.1 hypothetical protein H310_14576 [Aphanomyces invadans]RHY27803.1 hypothetical protein DYB32_006523 [Aphanomyces invadans]|eukprot:XP_008880679.1 hypothetical protein H310_14576 [Aphanomyces invadans]